MKASVRDLDPVIERLYLVVSYLYE